MRNALHSISNVMNKIEVSDLILVTRLIFLGMKVIVAWKCWLENINCHFISTLKTISLQSRSYLLTCENQNKTIYYLKMFRIVFCQKISIFFLTATSVVTMIKFVTWNAKTINFYNIHGWGWVGVLDHWLWISFHKTSSRSNTGEWPYLVWKWTSLLERPFFTAFRSLCVKF